jgi:hypothetical protein
MSRNTSRNALALALAWAAVVAPSCSSNNTDADAGGVGGSGGAGGSSVDKDAASDAVVDTGLVGCLMSAPPNCPSPAPKYSDVQPILEQRCVTGCHDGTTIDPVVNAPIWSLADYQSIFDWQMNIRSDILGCTMPPQDAGVPATVDELSKLLTWIVCGLPK